MRYLKCILWCCDIHCERIPLIHLINISITSYRYLLEVGEVGTFKFCDQPWDFFGRNDAKAETPVLWPPHAKSWRIGKDSDAGRDWGREEKGTTEDKMAGWHHWLHGRESQWTLGVGDGQGGLVCCDSWGRKESDTTEQLHWTVHMEDPLGSPEQATLLLRDVGWWVSPGFYIFWVHLFQPALLPPLFVGGTRFLEFPTSMQMSFTLHKDVVKMILAF